MRSSLRSWAWVAALIARFAGAVFAASSPNQAIDRPYSLRLGEPFVLERQIGEAMHAGDDAVRMPLGFSFPGPCRTNDSACLAYHGYAFADSTLEQRLQFAPLGAYELRFERETSHAFEGGLLVSGYRRALSFRLDARMFTELHEDFGHASYDREFIEKQDEEASGSVAYTSYARYRGELNYDAAIGRFSAGRDTPHWGPGLYHNLVFHRDAIPFHQASFRSDVGPLRVISLYGQLQGEDERVFSNAAKSRSVYAHRYEWAAGPDWLFGISEQLIVYSYEEPFAALPILPLFIFKGGAYERLNNGNIAGDVNWRFAPWGRVYGEFLIDDIQSPTSLFDDNWGNKWAAMAGLHLQGSTEPMFPATVGLIVEGVRLEPWVYTHYEPGTAQSLNRGYPLGDGLGPDAWAIDVAVYAEQGPWVGGLRGRWGEKGGTDAAQLLGSPPRNSTRKHFLEGPVRSLNQWKGEIGYRWKRISLRGELGYGSAQDTAARTAGSRSWMGWVGLGIRP